MVEKQNRTLPQGVEFSHILFKRNIKNGDIVIDATAGNGKDTLFLARQVGPGGKVYAFDIQKQAIENTEELLKNKGLIARVNLIQADHRNVKEYINTENINGVIFNLGFLPGGNKEIITRPDSTLPALQYCLKVLEPGGIIVLVIYSGHIGGGEEKEVLIDYCKNLDYKLYNVLNYEFINQKNPPAQVLAIEKRIKEE